MVSGIYQIKNQINGNRYVGSAVNLNQRWSQHLSGLRHNTHHNRHLQAAFRKYGESAFIFTVLEDITDALQLIRREQYFLDTLLPEYNLSPTAGSVLGFQHSQETKRKISKAQIGKHLSKETCKKISEARKGMPHPHKGYPLSEDTRRKIGEKSRGRYPSEATRSKMSEAWSAERRLARGDMTRGKSLSEETRTKMSKAHKGVRLSAKHRRKIGKGRIGKHHSIETKRKISIAQKARWRKICAIKKLITEGEIV